MRDVLLGEAQGSLDLLCLPQGAVNVTMPLPIPKASSSGLTLSKASSHFRPKGKNAKVPSPDSLVLEVRHGHLGNNL